MRVRIALLLAVLVLSLALAASPLLAAEATPEPAAPAATEAAPLDDATAQGTTTLILLIGLGAVLAVGGLALLRERYENDAPGAEDGKA